MIFLCQPIDGAAVQKRHDRNLIIRGQVGGSIALVVLRKFCENQRALQWGDPQHYLFGSYGPQK
jgi:hypothetical protein